MNKMNNPSYKVKKLLHTLPFSIAPSFPFNRDEYFGSFAEESLSFTPNQIKNIVGTCKVINGKGIEYCYFINRATKQILVLIPAKSSPDCNRLKILVLNKKKVFSTLDKQECKELKSFINDTVNYYEEK